MKNKHYGMLVVIYVLLFSSLFFVYREKDISNFYNNFDYFQNYENKNGYISFESRDFDRANLISKLKKLSNNENIAFMITNNIRENDEVIRFDNYYIGSEESLIKLLPKYSKINFKDFNNGIYLSNKDKHSSQKLLTFYEIEYNIYPIDNILEEDFELFTIDFYHNKNEAEINSKIKNELSDFLIKIDVLNREEYNVNNGLTTNIIKILVIMFVLSSVSSMFFISNNIKTIGIYKLNGIKKIDIWKRIYSKYMLVSMGLSVFIPIVGFFMIFRTIIGRVVNPLLFIIFAGMLVSLLNLIISIFFINIIGKLRLSEIIKGRNINKKLTTMSYILVIIAGIIIVPIINDNMIRLSEGITFINEKYFSIKDHSQYSTLNIDKYIDNNELKQKVIDELDKDKALIKFEPTAIFSQDFNEDNRYLAFFINEKYLNNQIYKLNNKDIDLSSEKDVIIFMDKRTFEIDEWSIEQFVFEGGKTAEIKLFDYVRYENYSDELVKRYSNYKPIFIYAKDDKNFNSQRLIIDSNNIEEAKDILVSNGINQDVEFINGKETLNSMLKNALTYFGIQFMTIIPFLLTFFSVAKSFSELMKITNKKKWTVKRIFGYSKLRIYLDVLVDFLIISIAILLSRYIFSNINIYSILILFIILVIVYMITLISIKNTKISKEVNHL